MTRSWKKWLRGGTIIVEIQKKNYRSRKSNLTLGVRSEIRYRKMVTCFGLKYSMKCRWITGAGKHTFLLSRHIGFGNLGGLGWGTICRWSRSEVKKWARREGKKNIFHHHYRSPVTSRIFTNPLPVTIQYGSIGKMVCQAFCSKLTPTMQALWNSAMVLER